MVEIINNTLINKQSHKPYHESLGKVEDLDDIENLFNEVEDFAKREKSSGTAATEETFPDEISVSSSIEVSLITFENEEFNWWDKLRAIKEQSAKIENGITNLMKREQVFRSTVHQKRSSDGQNHMTSSEKGSTVSGPNLNEAIETRRQTFNNSPIRNRREMGIHSSSKMYATEAHEKTATAQSSKTGEVSRMPMNTHIGNKKNADYRVCSVITDDQRSIAKSLESKKSIASILSLLADTTYDLKAASISAMVQHRQAIISAIALEKSIYNDPSRQYFIPLPNRASLESIMVSQDSTIFDDISIIDLTKQYSMKTCSEDEVRVLPDSKGNDNTASEIMNCQCTVTSFKAKTHELKAEPSNKQGNEDNDNGKTSNLCCTYLQIFPSLSQNPH